MIKIIDRKTIFAYPWGGRELFYSFTLLPFYFILLCAFAVDLKKNNRRDAEHAEKRNNNNIEILKEIQ
jgi:hypothetical protein